MIVPCHSASTGMRGMQCAVTHSVSAALLVRTVLEYATLASLQYRIERAQAICVLAMSSLRAARHTDRNTVRTSTLSAHRQSTNAQRLHGEAGSDFWLPALGRLIYFPGGRNFLIYPTEPQRLQRTSKLWKTSTTCIKLSISKNFEE